MIVPSVPDLNTLEGAIKAPFSIAALDELLDSAPTGEILVLNAINYADICLSGREALYVVSEKEVQKSGIHVIYKNVAFKVSKACRPNEILLLDGRGTIVGHRRIIRN